MARLVGVLQTSHGPLTNLPGERWAAYREHRSHRFDVVLEDESLARAKAARASAALEVLRAKLAEMNPDVLVVFGDDQNEGFDFNNFPSLLVYVGESFEGSNPAARGDRSQFRTVPGHRALAVHLLLSLLGSGFDPAFAQSLPNEEHGMCHAVMRPLEFFDAYSIPTIPILVNGYYPPQPRASRCYAIGKAIRRAIDSYDEDLRVVAIGSGGLWHTPRRPESYLNEAFDQQMLRYLEKGDVRAMADYFDSYVVPDGDVSQEVLNGARGMTGMPSIAGPQMGTREICNWIGAAATADGRPEVIVDYIPMYSSPIGTAFAYCEDIP